MIKIDRLGTEYLAASITFKRGESDDIQSVGVWWSDDPDERPEDLDDFTSVDYVDAEDDPDTPLAESGKRDILVLVGPDGEVELDEGTYQFWVRISTEDEEIIRHVGRVRVE